MFPAVIANSRARDSRVMKANQVQYLQSGIIAAPRDNDNLSWKLVQMSAAAH